MCLLLAERQCATPNGLNGNCLSIRECPALLSLVSDKVEDEHRGFLRQSQCGTRQDGPLVKFNYHIPQIPVHRAK